MPPEQALILDDVQLELIAYAVGWIMNGKPTKSIQGFFFVSMTFNE